ncbi:MAG: metallophosphoesterase [Polyangiales bacterium]
MIALAGGVSLRSPGALFIEAEGALVVADLHAGYVDTLRHRGHALPPVSDEGLLRALDALLASLAPRRVVVAGDLVHGAAAAHQRVGGESALDALLARFEGRALEVVLGNHDRALTGALASRGVTVRDEAVVGPHRVRHGDEAPEALLAMRGEACARRGYLVVGHHHPALRLTGGPGVRARLPAFAWGEGFIALPALSPFALGSDLLRRDYAAALEAVLPAREMETAVVIGEEVRRTGRLDAVRGAISSRGPRRR